MTVTPVVIDMESVGRAATSQIRVINTWETPVAVEITVERVELDEQGQPQTTPAEEDFLVFPPQAAIPPGRTQIFRIQYLGEPDLAQSRSYLFGVRQLPVELPEGRSGIQVLFNFLVVVSVAPPGARPELRVVAAEPVVAADGGVQVALTVENTGRGHGYLSRVLLSLRYYDADGALVWSERFSPEEMARLVGVGLLQPGKRRRFLIPIQLPAPGGRVEAEVMDAGRR